MVQLTIENLIAVIDYFTSKESLLNLILCNKKMNDIFIETTVSPLNLAPESLKFFPNLKIQRISKPEHEKIKGIEQYIILYPVSCHKYYKHKNEKNIKYTKIEFIDSDRKEFGNAIPPECTIISDYCFNESDITEITFPPQIKRVSLNSFLRCNKLKKIYVASQKVFLPRISFTLSQIISETNSVVCGDVVFTLNDRIHSMIKGGRISTTALIPKGVHEVGEGCFENCPQFENVSIPQTVKYIRDRALSGCLFLQSAALPNDTMEIGMSSFSNCVSLKEIVFPPFLFNVGKSAFMGCTSLSHISFGDHVTTIDFCTFKDCSSLRTVDLPKNLESIGHRAFCGCRNLKQIQFPETLTRIGYCSFNECVLLSKVDWHKVLVIEGGAFSDCESLKSVDLSHLKTISDHCFSNCYQLSQVVLGNELTTIGNNAFFNCKKLKNITFPNSLSEIGNDSFNGCSDLDKSTLPPSLSLMGKNCFKGCVGNKNKKNENCNIV